MKYKTPMSQPICHMDMCRALHNLHRATLNKTWIFEPLAISFDKRDNSIVYVAYLEERLYIFRKGKDYRMAYGRNPTDAYLNAYAETEKLHGDDDRELLRPLRCGPPRRL